MYTRDVAGVQPLAVGDELPSLLAGAIQLAKCAYYQEETALGA
ncbi:MAG: hypothetical protein ACLVB5_14785 [Christensenellales bacterium]